MISINEIKTVLNLVLISHGIKTGPLPKADLYIDCRGIYEEGIQMMDQESSMRCVMAHNDTFLITQMILDGIPQIERRRRNMKHPYSSPYVVCFFCAYGMHRSPTTKRIIGKDLKEMGWRVEILNTFEEMDEFNLRPFPDHRTGIIKPQREIIARPFEGDTE